MSNVAEGTLWKVAAHNEQMRTHAWVVTRGKFGDPGPSEKIYDPPQKPRAIFWKVLTADGVSPRFTAMKGRWSRSLWMMAHTRGVVVALSRKLSDAEVAREMGLSIHYVRQMRREANVAMRGAVCAGRRGGAVGSVDRGVCGCAVLGVRDDLRACGECGWYPCRCDPDLRGVC